MKVGKLSKTDRAEKLHPSFKLLFDFVKRTDFDTLPFGKITVDGDNVYIMNLEIQGKDKSEQPLEIHREYIDVHILLKGKELIGWKPFDEITTFSQEYDKTADCALSEEASRFYVELHPGEFCIVYPEDAHSPAINDGPIRKLIGKVKIYQ
ncbi:MAG: YhcH/YjgK/YiaL family protein [Muribaculaceae bacterium]|nr:YhcH/YjgK/YiaL family protein [Muribaculaceae bacterium]